MAEVKLPSNSDKFSEEKDKSNIIIHKKSEASKIAKGFFAEDAKNVKNYILKDILLPSLKKLIEDIIVNGVSTILWGESKGMSSSKKSPLSRISYNQYYDRPSSFQRKSLITPQEYDMDEEIIFETKREADDAYRYMLDVLDRYKVVRLADYYDYVSETYHVNLSVPYTYNNYGWASLQGTQLVQTRRGWVLNFPKLMPID